MTARLFELVPRLTALLVAGGLVLAAEVAILVLSIRRLRRVEAARKRVLAGERADVRPAPPRAFEWAAALLPLAVFGLAAWSVQTCRRMMLQGLAAPGQPDNADLIGRGMSGEIQAGLVGLLLGTPLLALAGVAVAFAVSARLRAAGLTRALPAGSPEAAAWTQHPGPAVGRLLGAIGGFFLLGLGPVLVTAARAQSHRFSAFARLAGFDPGERLELLEQHMAEVTAELKVGLLLARIGLAIAALLAVKLLVLDAPSRARSRMLNQREAGGAGVVVLAALFTALAAAAFVVARPWQRENDTPWPALSRNSGGPTVSVNTPELTGPDELQPGPVLAIAANMALDGRIIELKDLEEALWARRDRFTLMHPGQLFDRRLVVMCARGTPRERIDPALAAALRAGYERPALAFVKQESTERPLFGRRTRLLTTTAAFTLVASADQAEEGASVVDNYRGCIDLAAHLVVRRRQGKNVALVVGK